MDSSVLMYKRNDVDSMNGLRQFLSSECSPVFVEYGLLVVVIAIAALTAVSAFGSSVLSLFTLAAN